MAVPPDRLQGVWVLSWRRIRFVSHLLRSQEGNDEAKKKEKRPKKATKFCSSRRQLLPRSSSSEQNVVNIFSKVVNCVSLSFFLLHSMATRIR